MFFSGSNWAYTTVLFAADYLTWKRCSLDDNQCKTKNEEKQCEILGGVCRPYIDAYYIEVTLCTVGGIIWLLWKYRKLKYLQNLPINVWQIRNNRRKSELSEDDNDSISVTTA